jgi:hypothetical protein
MMEKKEGIRERSFDKTAEPNECFAKSVAAFLI